MTHSVVIVTRNRAQEVKDLLHCLAVQTTCADEILVVDASDTDETSGFCSNDKPAGTPLRYLRADADICTQRNIGIESSCGDIITFLDDDARIGPDYCATMLRYFENDASISGVGGSMTDVPLPGLVERVFRCLFFIQTNRGRNRFRLSGFPDFGFAFPHDREVDFLASTAASFRKSAIGALRFDTGAFSGRALGLQTGRAFAEDVWFSFQVGRSGRLIVGASLAFFHTPSPASRDGVHVTQTLYYHAMRTVSARMAHGIIQQLARRWALIGCGLLAMIQTVVKRDLGYLTGYLASSRLPASSRTA
ncbi:MAG: glycosyltransferase family 2 protein [Ignavibacteriae bacterium]|nr:glycosyltransferase family 2 protein [Ignavibacteriota bacterium]